MPRPTARLFANAALFPKLALVALALVVLAGCAQVPAVPSGFVATAALHITVEREAGARELYNAERRARIVASDGTVAFDGRLSPDTATAITVPAGSYNVSTFTVFFGDFLQCPSDPGDGSPPVCVQPTLRPNQICDLLVNLPASGLVELRFTVASDGGCRLEDLGRSPSASASAS